MPREFDLTPRRVPRIETPLRRIVTDFPVPESLPVLEHAADRGLAVIVMRPLGGSGRTSAIRGRMARGQAGPLTPANLLRYVLSCPAVSVVIPGARYPDRIRVNVAAVESFVPMSPAEMRELELAAAALYD